MTTPLTTPLTTPMTTRWFVAVLAVSACGGGDSGPPPIAKVPGKLGQIAVNNTSIFAINTADDTIIELGRLSKIVLGQFDVTHRDRSRVGPAAGRRG